MRSRLFIGSALASLSAIAVACTITTERPADSSPPPSPPPPVPATPAPAPATTAPVVDAGTPPLDAGSTATDAGSADAGVADAAAPPPKKNPIPNRPKADAGTATGDGGT